MLKDLFITFFKIGLFTFGGGYAMIANMREAVVDEKHWLSEEEMLEVIAIAESTPGPISINTATYVGYKKKGVLGSAMATLGSILPSLIIMFIISLFLDEFMKNKFVSYAFVGIKCAVAFLIIRAGLSFFKNLPKEPLPLIVFAAALLLLLAFEIFAVSFSTIVFIVVGGAIGIVAYGLIKAGEEKA